MVDVGMPEEALQQEVENLTCMLCLMCGLREIPTDLATPEEEAYARMLERWWAANKVADVERRARWKEERSQRRIRALSKLTYEDRVALGLPTGEEGS